ncbi:MAG TPA: PQQ-binding-like beta-propeller repeat protein [Gaiellales bacterium]|jgi:outer membrane protein assembly factor BamB|nr:PQQ-binding-like beta-propeller repeat protein [Gaiellales bacterium]
MRRRKWALAALAAVVLLAGGAGVAWWAAHRLTGDVHRGNALPFTFTAETTSTSNGGTKQHRATDFGPAWPVYGRTMARTRDAADLGSIRPPYHVAWRDATGFLEYPPSYRDGVLYLTSNSGFATAREAKSGHILWSRRIGVAVLGEPGAVTGEPAVVGTRMYLGARDHEIYALGIRTGHVVWKHRLPSEMESSPAYGDGRLYMSDLAGHVRALDLKTGRLLWTFTTSGPVKHGPALAGGRLYFGDYDGVMYCIDAATGRLVWRTATHGLASGFAAGQFYSTPAVAYGRVYVGSTDHKVYAFQAGDGQIAWTYTLPYWAYGSPAVWNGRVYATSYDGTFVSLSARTGRVLWRRHLPFHTTSSPTVIGPLVYVADLGPARSHGHLYAYNPVSGRLVWRFNDGKYSTVIAGEGRLIIAGMSHLYALRPRHAPS